MNEAHEKEHFYVAELPNGTFVAASNRAPYFCFRDVSEEAVFAKVDAALTFYYGKDRHRPAMQPRPTTTVHNWVNKKAVPFKEYAPAEAA